MAQSSPNLHGRAQLVMALRGKGITNRSILEALEKVPREDFVDALFEAEAYTDRAIPIACGQTISQPFVVAYMSEALEVGPRMRVLEIGTGSGYQAAVLAHLAGRVYSIERHRPLLEVARKRLEKLKLHNVVTRHGDGFLGWKEQAPFDRIILTAAVDAVPKLLIDQLKPGGILIAPIAPQEAPSPPAESIYQSLTKIMHSEQGLVAESLIKVLFVPMVEGLPQETRHGMERSR